MWMDSFPQFLELWIESFQGFLTPLGVRNDILENDSSQMSLLTEGKAISIVHAGRLRSFDFALDETEVFTG